MKKLLIVLMALALVLCGTAFAESEPVKLAWIVQDMVNESQSYACRIAEEMVGDLALSSPTTIRPETFRSALTP